MQPSRVCLILLSSMVLVSSGIYASEEITVDLPGGAQMEMVWITPGKFLMGFPGSEGGDVELTRLHGVTISRGFYLGKYELTQEQWESVMGSQPWEGEDNVLSEPTAPAVSISWDDMQEFVHQLNQAAGDSLYRLPTEAEWEYACRAESTTRWSFGDDEMELWEYAWYSANVEELGLFTAKPVGSLLPNRWGLYDMHGNVLEWVQDWWGNYPSSDVVDPTGPEIGSFRVLRSGSFEMDAGFTRSASRVGDSPEDRYHSIGARLVRVEPKATAITPQSWGQTKQPSR